MMTKDDKDLMRRASNPDNKLSRRDKRRVLGLCARLCSEVDADREALYAEGTADQGPEMWDIPHPAERGH